MKYSLIYGDALEKLKEIPDMSFDACFCDPPYGYEFMGKAWDHGVPNKEVWTEILRIVKPGAHCLAFGGTRTFHRLTVNIEDAGFEIRDCLMWLYGSGFPKSLDISKAIDKGAGVEREVPATDSAKLWNGYGTALKPAWEPCIVAMKPKQEGSFAENALKYGIAGLNINDGRIGKEKIVTHEKIGIYGTGSAEKMRQYGFRPYNIDNRHCVESIHLGRWPANLILNEESAVILDEQSGELTSGQFNGIRKADKFRNTYSDFSGTSIETGTWGDSGGASRFFYCAKVSTDERESGVVGKNSHPTLKPIDLCRYIAKLILPPERETQRRIIVPFCGTGSEMIGCLNAGWDEAIGIDNDKNSLDIAEQRLSRWLPSLFVNQELNW